MQRRFDGSAAPVRVCMGMLASTGGSSIVAQEIGAGLAAHAVEARHCRLGGGQPGVGDGSDAHFILDAGPGNHTSALLEVPTSLGGAMDAASQLLRIHDAWPFDVFHLHNLQVYGCPAQLLHQLRGVPYVVTCHGSDVLSSHLLDGNLEVAAAVLRGAAAVTCVSSHMASALCRKIPDLESPHVIPNFLRANWSALPPTDGLAMQPEAGRFLHVSSMREVKRPALLLDAFGILRQTMPQAQLVVVSTASGARRTRALLAQAGRNGQGVSVVDGDAQPGQIRQEYRRAQGLVLASRFEGFGLVVLEALAHGVPVIAPRAGALPEILGEDWPYLVADDDSPDLADALATAMARATTAGAAPLAQRMNKILERYQGPAQIARYAEIYRHVLSSPTIRSRPPGRIQAGLRIGLSDTA